jgi:hypothetical protein
MGGRQFDVYGRGRRDIQTIQVIVTIEQSFHVSDDPSVMSPLSISLFPPRVNRGVTSSEFLGMFSKEVCRACENLESKVRICP